MKKRTIADTKPLDAKGYVGDLPIEEILESLELDFNFFEENGIDCSVTIGEAGLLDLSIQSGKDSMRLSFGNNEITYKYRKGLLANAIKEKRRRTI